MREGPTIDTDWAYRGVDTAILEYVWQQHVALGRPLVDPGARLDVPATRGQIGDYGDGQANARLESNAPFEWPDVPRENGGTVDLATDFPDLDAEIHDVTFATDLDAGESVSASFTARTYTGIEAVEGVTPERGIEARGGPGGR